MRPPAIAIVLLGLLAVACVATHTPQDAGPPPRTEPLRAVDLLLVIDNSCSMAEEQTSLAMALPALIGLLAKRGIDLHVGVVTTDLGTGGFRVPTCAEPNLGDAAALRTQGNTTIPGCLEGYPSFLALVPTTAPDAFTTDLACVMNVGVGGCGFEQALEALLDAVTPSTSALRFPLGSLGQADRDNAGFLRDDALLAVIVVTDEDDGSARDPEIFDPGSTVYDGDLNLRVFSYPDAMHPPSRYAEGLLAAKGDDPSRVFFAAIAGVPPPVIDTDTPAPNDYDAILAYPAMIEQIDPAMPTRLATSCNVAGRGFAFAPRRIVTTARELDDRGTLTRVESICQADFTPGLRRIADGILAALEPPG